MAETVKFLPQEISDIIEVYEWDMRTGEGIDRFREIKAKSLPSIAIDSQLVFESIIPTQHELIAAILERRPSRREDSV